MPAQAELIIDRANAILALLEVEIAAANMATAEAIGEGAKRKILEGPHTGTLYTGDVAFRTIKGRVVPLPGPDTSRPYPHQASAPGEPPANWTGVLAGAIKTEAGPGPGDATVLVDDSEAPYAARFLENGSPGGFIQPRPFFHPSVEEHRPLHLERVAQALKKAAV